MIRRLTVQYDQLADKLDDWFIKLKARYSSQIQCKLGCARCCYGLFDVSLPDAVRVAQAFGQLPEITRDFVSRRAWAIQEQIEKECCGLTDPYFLFISAERVDGIVESIGEVRCPFLGEQNQCLIYDARPIACRLEGIPMVDTCDGLFGDWCDLNFKDGFVGDPPQDLCLDYYEIQAIEQKTTEKLSAVLLSTRLEEVTVFIPSIVAAYEGFWKICDRS